MKSVPPGKTGGTFFKTGKLYSKESGFAMKGAEKPEEETAKIVIFSILADVFCKKCELKKG